MAETKRMTAEQVVSFLLEGEEGLDLLRESLEGVVQQLMEAEVSDLFGAGRGERSEERLTHCNGYWARRWETRAGELELAIRSPAAARTSRASSSRAAAPSRCLSRSCRRPMSLASRRGRSTRWSSRSGADLEERGLPDLPGPGRAGRRVPQPALRGPLSVPVARRQGREGPRRRPCRAQAPGARLRGARVRLPRGDRPRCRRGRDAGLLAQLPPLTRRAWPRGGPARRLRRARRFEEGDRAGARLSLATLHRHFPPRIARPVRGISMGWSRRCFGRFHLRRGRERHASSLARRSSGCGSAAEARGACSKRRRTTCSPSTPVPSTTGRSSSRNRLERVNR